MDRTELTLKLEMLRDLIANRKVRNEVRDLLDSLIGEFKYGGTPNPWAKCTQIVRDSIPKSVNVQKLIDSGLSNKELQYLLRTEHTVTVKQLTVLLREGRIDEVIDRYSVVFVTRDEDNLLKEVEKQGMKDGARYHAAGIEFELTEEQVVTQYTERFGMLNPPLDYGHHNIEWNKLVKLARVALDERRPIPWDDMLAPLPPGAVS